MYEGDVIYRISYFPKCKQHEIKEIDDKNLLILINNDELLDVVQVYDDADSDDIEYSVFVSICPDFSESDDDICASALTNGLYLIRKHITKIEQESHCYPDEVLDDETTGVRWDSLCEKAERYKKSLEEIVELLKVLESLKKTIESYPPINPWVDPLTPPINPWVDPLTPPINPVYPFEPYSWFLHNKDYYGHKIDI